VPTDEIIDFLRGIGLRVDEADLLEDTFLPGVRVAPGGIAVDRARLRWPGDLLHEAGHVAVMPAADRAAGGPVHPQAELAAIPWSYAAAVHVGLDPAVVFHEGGYGGRAEALLASIAAGVPPGLHLLEAAGLAASPRRAAGLGVEPYPHMLRWLAE
jgi:hypothetical protein